MITLQDIYVYPIKSLGGVSVKEWKLTGRGLRDDRRWMLVDEAGTFITQRQVPEMALLKLGMNETDWEVNHSRKEMPSLIIPREIEDGEQLNVTIFSDECMAIRVGEDVDQWFQEALGITCHLVYMPEESERQIDPRYAPEGANVSFADGYPYLLLGQASIDGLNARLDQPVPTNRFRPNLVVVGTAEHEEDSWEEIRIGEAYFDVAKPCARCVLTTVDQETGVKGKEPLFTLSTYRKEGNKVLFGQNLLWKSGGSVSVGAEVAVVSVKSLVV